MSCSERAGVAELADAWDLKSHVGNDVPVRARSPAPVHRQISTEICRCFLEAPEAAAMKLRR